ncbi:NADase-type glycan-binding domain-containing protein [Actinopolymorpha pittospori]
MIICAGCGERNADGVVFCAQCGVFLEWEGEKVSDPNAASRGAGAGLDPGLDAGANAGIGAGVDAFQAGTTGGSGHSDYSDYSHSGRSRSGDAVPFAGSDVSGSQVVGSDLTGAQVPGSCGRGGGVDRGSVRPDSTKPRSTNPSSTGPGSGRSTVGGSVSSGSVDPHAQPGAAQPGAAQPGAAQPVTPRQPQQARRRRPPTRGPAQNIPTGSLICGACAMPNQSDRKFCARCGHSLATANVVRKAPWWRRLFGRERVYEVGTRRAPGQPGRRLGTIVRVGVVVLVLAGVGVLAGPQRGLVISAYNGVQNLLLKPEQVRPTGQQASAAAKAHPASHAFDGTRGTFWAPARTSVKDGAVPWLRATFAEPVNLVTVGITPGMSVDTPKFVAGTRPAEIEVSVTTDGDPVVKRLHVADTAGFQKFDIEAPGARSVQIAVLSSTGAHPTLATAITEVEFWAKR